VEVVVYAGRQDAYIEQVETVVVVDEGLLLEFDVAVEVGTIAVHAIKLYIKAINKNIQHYNKQQYATL